MRKFFINLLCCFVPKKEWRRALRNDQRPYTINGTGNKIYLGDKLLDGCVRNLYLEINGNNNTVYLPAEPQFVNCGIRIFANNANIKIEDSTHKITGLFINCCSGDNQRVHIGRNFHCFGISIQLNEENAALEIGDECLFSNSISIWPTDGHAMIDCKTDEIINQLSGAVQIGNKCWIGEGVKILKNAKIPSNTIVGAASVVCKKFTNEYTALAGNPARVVRTGVTWNSKNATHLLKYRKEKQNEQ